MSEFTYQTKRNDKDHGAIQKRGNGPVLEDRRNTTPVQRKNQTGLPDNLKSGMENLSGKNLDHVKVHYNSPKPALVQAHAYAQGSDIHLASGQEKHLPHELGHVVQQMEGRVKATRQLKTGISINDDKGLEKEADVMGSKALENQTGTAQLIVNQSSLTPLITQLAATKVSEDGGAGSTYNKVVYQDKASNFTGGTDAGDNGLWPVGRGVIKGEYYDGAKWVDIPNGFEEIQQGTSEYYFCGHMLAKSLGGLGGADNIFAQDTNNNIGRWPSAEEAIRTKRDALKPTDNMRVSIGLAGRDGKKLQQVKIKGEQLDTVVNTESKIASKMLDF